MNKSNLTDAGKSPPIDEIKKRESIEWCNTWYDCASDFERPRFLFVGDSIARQYRSSFARCFPEIAVDCFCTSSVFFDGALFQKQLDSFLEYKYDLIFIHLGGMHGANKEIFTRENFAEIYKEKLNNLIDYLGSNIILVSTTPVMLLNNGKFSKQDKVFCEKILFINSLMKQTAEDKNLTFVDLYPFAIENKFKYTDAMHFEKKYQILIAEKIITDVLKQNKLNDEFINKFKEAKKKALGLQEKELNRFFAIKKTRNRLFICFLGIKISIKIPNDD